MHFRAHASVLFALLVLRLPAAELRGLLVTSVKATGHADAPRLSLRGGNPSKVALSPGDSAKRIAQDTMKLMKSDYRVQLDDDQTMRRFSVMFRGPKDTAYEGGVWKVNVELPNEYPYKSPSIGFANKIFHPNVDEASGSVCLDVINQSWKPFFDLTNIFEVFLPQLLTYPNPSDPLNGEAAALAMRDHTAYNTRIREYVRKYASPAVELEFVQAPAVAGRGREGGGGVVTGLGCGVEGSGGARARPPPPLDLNRAEYSESASSSLSDESS